jgi:hypothetical protein
MAKVLLTLAGSIFLVMGALHGLLTLRDITRPKSFTPIDEAVRIAMQGTQLAFNPRANLWRAWLGFNLSHSLGVVIVGGALLFTGLAHAAAFEGSGLFQAITVLIGAAYFAISLKFWFWGPSLGSGIALLCILGAVVL